jgi:hypothetical protein
VGDDVEERKDNKEKRRKSGKEKSDQQSKKWIRK